MIKESIHAHFDMIADLGGVVVMMSKDSHRCLSLSCIMLVVICGCLVQYVFEAYLYIRLSLLLSNCT